MVLYRIASLTYRFSDYHFQLSNCKLSKNLTNVSTTHHCTASAHYLLAEGGFVILFELNDQNSARESQEPKVKRDPRDGHL